MLYDKAFLLMIILFAAFGIIGLLVIAAFQLGGSHKKLVKQKLQALEDRLLRGISTQSNARLDNSISQTRWQQQLSAFVPRIALLKQRIERAGLMITPLTFAGICLATGLSIAVSAWLIIHSSVLLSIMLGFSCGISLPILVLNFLGNRRTTKFLTEFPEAIELMLRGLKSGLPLQETVGAIARELAEPVKTEFAAAEHAIRIGCVVEEALWTITKRIDSQDFKFLVTSISVQRETGGNLTETLQNLSDILRKRRHMRLKVRALSSEARTSGYIIGALPFLMLGFMYVSNPGYLHAFISDPRGQTMSIIGGLSFLTGVFTMWKMTKFEI